MGIKLSYNENEIYNYHCNYYFTDILVIDLMGFGFCLLTRNFRK